MALQKTFQTNFGVSGDYCTVKEVILNPKAIANPNVIIEVNVFKNEDAYTDRKDPLLTKKYTFSLSSEFLNDQKQVFFWEEVYRFLKTHSDFEDAISV